MVDSAIECHHKTEMDGNGIILDYQK